MRSTFGISVCTRALVAASLLCITTRAASYAPVAVTCPTESLVRAATGLSSEESAYRTARKLIADEALKTWLAKTSSGFGVKAQIPTIALTTSGGGYRSLLSGAGVVQGLDERDSTVVTAGLFQALTYQTGLSGGAWLLSSFVASDYKKISELQSGLWADEFDDGLLTPDKLLAVRAYADIVEAIKSKEDAGFEAGLNDLWGRLLSYQLLSGDEGGIGTTLSSITGLSSFQTHSIPFPIITALGVKAGLGQCEPAADGTQYEFSPFEFGSWDSELSAFAKTKYIGSDLNNGQAATCKENYDNLGFVLGSSSFLFSALCADVTVSSNETSKLLSTLVSALKKIDKGTGDDLFAQYPNPFFNYVSTTAVQDSTFPLKDQKTLALVDGGLAEQNNPIWPLLQPARAVDVLLVNDNSDDNDDNFPSGIHLHTTYVQAVAAGLTRMPVIPPVETFAAQGLAVRATFFGCNATDMITIVYLPNKQYTYDSGIETFKMQFSKEDTAALIKNGVSIASQGDDAEWGVCLGCVILSKTDAVLDSACNACFAKYCYNE